MKRRRGSYPRSAARCIPSIRGEHLMQTSQNRRRFLATLSSATAVGLFGDSKAVAEEAPLETTRIRLYDWTGLCIAPQFVAEELLKAEGFTDVQYLRDEASGGALPNP